MSNFNLKYECLDAHDDCHAQLHKFASNLIPFWNFNNGTSIDIANELDQQHATSEEAEWEREAQIKITSIIGTTEKHYWEQVATMDKILCWLQWDKAKTLESPIILCEPTTLI